jgi:hypothetical protein
MCEKCIELDKKIAHYRRFENIGLDPLTTDRIKRLIDDIQRIRNAMHPDDASNGTRPVG